MIGIVVAAHEALSRELLNATSEIMSRRPQVEAVCFRRKDGPERLQRKMEDSVRSADSGQGVLVLVDLYGGRPARVAMDLALKHPGIEVVTGVHLPMLLEAVNHSGDYDLKALAERITRKGREFIVNAREYRRKSRGSRKAPCKK